MREITQRVKDLLPGVLREGEGGAPGDGYGGGGQGQGPESRFWEMDLPAFLERCLSSSISDPQALPFINGLFQVRLCQPIQILSGARGVVHRARLELVGEAVQSAQDHPRDVEQKTCKPMDDPS